MKVNCEHCGVEMHIDDAFFTKPTKENPVEKRMCADCYASEVLGVII